MRKRQVEKLAKQLLHRDRQQAATLDWQRMVRDLETELREFRAFLEFRDGTRVPVASVSPTDPGPIDVIGVAITVAAPSEPWDTEAPVRMLAERLSARLGTEVPVLLSRDAPSFVGYYARVRTTGDGQRQGASRGRRTRG